MARKTGKGKPKKGPRGLDFFLTLALVCVLAFIAGYLLFASHGKQAKAPKRAARKAPHKELREAPVPRAAHPAPVSASRVAIIIDDMGSDLNALDKVIAIGAPMDVAVLPMLRRSGETAAHAEKAGLEVLLHLPMQPKGGSLKGLGPGALLSGMDDKAIKETINKDLESVPGSVGVNNHMGSELTEERGAMLSVMESLKGRGLFFVDSRTTDRSAAMEAAHKEGVKSSSRRVFLDDSSDPADIKAQFDQLVSVAKRDGAAIAIGHPHPNTLAVLKEEIPSLKEKGVELVLVSRLVK